MLMTSGTGHTMASRLNRPPNSIISGRRCAAPILGVRRLHPTSRAQHYSIRTRIPMITKKTVQVELTFVGKGAVVEHPPGSFRGGVAEPDLRALRFNVLAEASDEDGVLNPDPGVGSVEGAFQVNIWGESESYRELGRYLLALAELDTAADPGFHDHHEFVTADKRTRVHLIIRKLVSPNDAGA
jgi:hypothetical protein